MDDTPTVPFKGLWYVSMKPTFKDRPPLEKWIWVSTKDEFNRLQLLITLAGGVEGVDYRFTETMEDASAHISEFRVCPNCGSSDIGNFCSDCGVKQSVWFK